MTDVVERAIYSVEATGIDTMDKLLEATIGAAEATNQFTQAQTKAVTANNNVAQSEEKVVVSINKVTAAKRTTTESLDRWIATMDKAAKAELQYQNGLERINRFQAEGVGNTEKLTQAHQALTQRYTDQIAAINKTSGAHNDNEKQITKSTTSTAQLRFATQNLTFQLNDIATGLASGQSPFRIMAQQTGQVLQVFQQGGGVNAVMAEFGKQIKGLVTPATVTAVAVLAVAAAIGVVVNRIEDLKAANRGFTTALGPISSPENLESIQKLQTQLISLGLSFSKAREQAEALARNPMLNPQRATQVVNVGSAVAARMGTSDVTVGIKATEEALKAGSAATIKLGSDTRLLTGEQAANLLEITRLKGGYDAMNKALEIMEKAGVGVRDNSLTPMQKATEKLNEEWNKFLNKMAETEAFEAVHSWLITLLQDVTRLLTGDFQVSPNSALGILLHLIPGGSILTGISSVISGMKSMSASAGSDPNNTGWRAASGVQVSGAVPAGGDYASNFNIASKVQRTGLFPQIADILSHGSEAALPQGWQLMLSSVGRVGGSNSKVGMGSQHVGGNAGDFQLIGPDGTVYPVDGKDITPGGLYGQVYNKSLDYAKWAYPDLGNNMISGAQFDSRGLPRGSPGYRPDIGHIDFRGGAQFGAGQPLGATSTVLPPADVEGKRTDALKEQETQIKKNLEAERMRGALQQAQLKYNEVEKQAIADNIDGTKAKEMAQAAYNEVVSKAVISQNKYNEEQKLSADYGTKTAQAYQEGVVPGLQAAAEEQAALAALIDPFVNKEQRKQQILKASAIQAAQAAGQQSSAAITQIKLEEDLAASAAKGTAAYHDQQVVNEAVSKTQDVYNKALASGDAALIAIAKREIETAIAQAKRIDVLKQTTAAQVAANQNIDQTAILQKEIELQGKTSEEIQYQISLLQIRQRLQNEFANAEPEARQRFKETSEALARTNLQLAQAQREQQRIDDMFRSIGNTIDQNITQALEDAFNGKKVTDFATVIKNQLGGILAQITSGLFVRPIIGSVLSSFGLSNAASSFGSIGSIIGAAGGGNASSSASGSTSGGLDTGTLLQGGGLLKDLLGFDLKSTFSGVTDFFSGGLGGIFAHTPTAADFAAGVGPVLEAPGSLFGSTSIGGFLGGAGLGFGAGTLLNGLLGGNQLTGTAGSGVGSLAGAAIGSALLPGVGTLLGGLFGGAGGGLLGGLFGQTKKPDNASGGVINLATGKISGVQSSGNAENDATASKIGTVLSAAVTRALQIPGAQLPGGAVAIQAGSRDGIKLSFGGQEFKFKDADAAISAGLNALRDNLTGVSESVSKVLHSIGSPDQVEDALAFAAAYDKLSEQASKAFAEVEKDTNVVGPFATAMQQIQDLFNGLRDKAISFGLSIDPINQALDEATRRLQGDFRKALSEALTTSTGQDFINQLEATAKSRDQLFTEASSIGIARDSVSDQINTIAANQAREILKPLTEEQLNIVVDAMKDTRPEFADMARELINTAKAARETAAALAANNLELERQAFAYQAQQDFDTANGEAFLATIRDLDKAAKAATAQLGPLNFASDSYQAGLIKETEHKSVLNTLQGLTNAELDRAKDLLEQLQPGLGAWADEARALADASAAAAAATEAQAAAQSRANDILNAQISIREYLNSLETSNNAFNTPKSRLEAAQSQFGATFAAAQGGDVTALRNITGVAQTLLQNVQEFYASSAAGQAIAKQVKESLTSLLGSTGTTASPKTTDDVVNAIIDDTNNVTNTITTSTALVLDRAITTSNDITAASVRSASEITSTVIAANNNIVNTTLSTGQDITNAALEGAASIVGTTAVGFTNQQVTLQTGTGSVVAANNATAAAVVISGNTLLNGTLAILDNNVTNAKSLIDSNQQTASDLIASNENNSAILQAANAAEAAAMIAANTQNANFMVNTNIQKTNELLAANDNQTANLINTAQATTNTSIAYANYNTAQLLVQNDAVARATIDNNNAASQAIVANANAKSDQTINTTVALANQSDAVVREQTANANAYAQYQVDTVNATSQNVVANANAKSDQIVNTTVALANQSDAVVREQTANANAYAQYQVDTANAVAAYNGAVQQQTAANIQNTTNSSAAAIADRNDAAAGAVIGNIAASTNATVNTTNATAGYIAGTTAASAVAVMAQTATSSGQIVSAILALGNTSDPVVNTLAAVGAGIANTIAGWSNLIASYIAAYGQQEANLIVAYGNAILGTMGAMTQWIVSSLYDVVINGIDATISAWGNAIYSIINGWSANLYNIAIAVSNENWNQAHFIASYIEAHGFNIVNNSNYWLHAVYDIVNVWGANNYNVVAASINENWNQAHFIAAYIEAHGWNIVNHSDYWLHAVYDNIGNWGNANVANANNNAGNIIGTLHYLIGASIQNTANWSNAIIQNQVAWDNASIGAINNQTNTMVNYLSWANNNNIQATFASADSIVATVANGAGNTIGSIWGAANSIIGMVAATGNNTVGAIYGAINSLIGVTYATASPGVNMQGVVDSVNNVAYLVSVASNGDLSNTTWNTNRLIDMMYLLAGKLDAIYNAIIGFAQFHGAMMDRNSGQLAAINDNAGKLARGLPYSIR